MDIWWLIRGFGLGLAISIPVGPIGMLVIRRTLAFGYAQGLATGLGAATADMTYGLLGVLSISSIISLMLSYAAWLQVLGGLWISWMGWQALRSTLNSDLLTTAVAQKLALGRSYLSGLLLTLTNPLTIMFFAALFTTIGDAATDPTLAMCLVFMSGVWLGSALWWLCLSSGVNLVRQRLLPIHLLWLNRIAGMCLLAWGLKVCITALT